MEMFKIILFIPLLFLFSLFLAFTIRKRMMEKIIFIEIDESLKDLRPWDFFYSILKMERTAKPIYYTEFFLLITSTIYILFAGYKDYLKEVEFIKKYPDFPITPISSTLIKLAIPITLCSVTFLLLLFALFMKKKENRRISEMLDNLDKYKLLNYAKEDFIKSDAIIETGVVIQSDIKIGDKYLFSIYPAYIIPYSWISDIKVDRVYNRGGSYSSLTFIFTKSFKSEKIFFAKREIAKKVRDFIWENKDFH